MNIGRIGGRNKMTTLPEIKKRIKEMPDEGDKEADHKEADMLLLDYIGDPELTEIFNSKKFWYS